MDGTIPSRAADGQRAHDGLRAFFGAQGVGAIASMPSTEGVSAPARLPSETEIREAGEALLETIFGAGWERRLESSRLDAVVAAPIDHQWVLRRIDRLKPMSDGPMRRIPKLIWDLSTALSQPDWLETWMELARRCPRDWLVQFCGLVGMKSPNQRRRGKRSFCHVPDDALRIDSRRVQSMLSLGVLAWMLCEYDPSDLRYPYVIRGLPYGAWQHLVAYWERYADRDYLHVPASTTLFGTHVSGGRWDRGECGYLAAWCQAGIAIRYQPNGKAAAPGYAGQWRKNKKGEWERWGFLELRLRVETPNLAPAAMGPSARPWLKLPPPPATGELEALINERERSWYTDEEPAADVAVASENTTPEVLPGPKVVRAIDSRENDAGGPASTGSSALTTIAGAESASEQGGAGLRLPGRNPIQHAIPASEWCALSARVDELERTEYVVPADGGGAHCGGGGRELENVATPRGAAELRQTVEQDTILLDVEATRIEVWRAPEPNSGQRADERPSIEATELASREVVQWLRERRPGDLPARPMADVVAASMLEPGALQAAPSPKFLAALQAYESEKGKRKRERADQKKRKPPW